MQNQIPKNWQKVRLGDYADVKGGKRLPKGLAVLDQQTEHPYLRIVDIDENGLELSDLKYISNDVYEKISQYTISDEDIYISIAGTIGLVGKVPKTLSGANLTENCAKICNLSENLDRDFLLYFLRSRLGKAEIKAGTGGSSQPKLALQRIENFQIPLTSKPDQQRIAAILSAFDDKIEVNNKIAKTLEEIAQAIYKEWFVKFRFPDHEKVKMVDSTFGKIPTDWEIKNIGQLLNYYIGGGWGNDELKDQFQIPAYVIRGTDIPEARHGSISGVPLRYHKESNFNSRKTIDKDIIFEVSGGSKDQPVGRALFVSQILLNQFKQDVICASFCKLLRVDKNILPPEIVYLRLIEIYESGKIYQYQVQSTGISNFKFESFIDKEIILIPDKETRDQFSKIIEPLFNQIQMLGSMNTSLKQTRDLLLPKLMKGEIRV